MECFVGCGVDVAAGLDQNARIEQRRSQVGIEGNVATADRDRPSNAGAVAAVDGNVCRVATLADGQATKYGAQGQAAGIKGAAELVGQRFDGCRAAAQQLVHVDAVGPQAVGTQRDVAALLSVGGAAQRIRLSAIASEGDALAGAVVTARADQRHGAGAGAQRRATVDVDPLVARAAAALAAAGAGQGHGAAADQG